MQFVLVANEQVVLPLFNWRA